MKSISFDVTGCINLNFHRTIVRFSQLLQVPFTTLAKIVNFLPIAEMTLDHDFVRSMMPVCLATDGTAVALVALLIAAITDCVVVMPP